MAKVELRSWTFTPRSRRVGTHDVVVEQDTNILRKIYSNTSQKIKLNNEVGMDCVRRNFESFPDIVEPNLSK